MADATTRRLTESPPRLTGRSWEDVAKELEEYLGVFSRQVEGGIPAGFNEVTPATLTPNSAATPGSESEGWAAGDHAHALDLLLSAKGDSLTRDGSGYVREAVGADFTLHEADASAGSGRAWRTLAAVLGRLLTTKGDLLTRNATDVVRKGVGANNTIIIADSTQAEGWKWEALPGCRVFHDAAQSILNNTSTVLAFNSERDDVNTMHDPATNNSRITIGLAGKFLIGAHVEFEANSTGARQVGIRLNGATFIALHLMPAAAVHTTRMHVTTRYSLAAADYLEVVVFQDSGVALNINVSGNYSPEFWAQRVN